MSRYTGPRLKVSRAVGVDLPGLTTRTIEKRPYPPGQHGQGRKKISEYGLRVLETRKVRMNYGITEGQLRSLMVEARRQGSATTTLLSLLERRIDNVLFRAGFALTIPAARQLVCHGRVTVNGKRMDIPSLSVRQGDVIVLRPTKAGLPDARFAIPEWLTVERDAVSVVVAALPDGVATLFPVNMQLIVEHYAMRL